MNEKSKISSDCNCVICRATRLLKRFKITKGD